MSIKYKVYSYREWEKILKQNGYIIKRTSGDHITWYNKDNNKTITSTVGRVNPMIARRLIKENNLKEI